MNALPDPAAKPEFYRGVPLKRLFAWVLDTVIIVALSLLILPFTAFTGLFFFPFLMLVVGFFYRWFSISSGSATWGMRIMAIELRDHEGQRLTSGSALGHTLGYSLSVAMAPAQLISIILMVVTDKGQGLTDMVLGTTAINKPSTH